MDDFHGPHWTKSKWKQASTLCASIWCMYHVCAQVLKKWEPSKLYMNNIPGQNIIAGFGDVSVCKTEFCLVFK